MRIPNPFLLAAKPIKFELAGKISFIEKLLLLAVIGSVCLDVLTNVTQYAGIQSSAVAMLKGAILVFVICCYRTLFSYLVTISFFIIFCARELYLVLTESDLFLMDDTVFFLRILFFVTWLLLFYEKRQSTQFLKYVVKAFVATITISVLCQVAGMALNIDFFKAYSDQRGGYKGLFFAENDTSVLYLPALIYGVLLWRAGKRSFALVCLTGLFLLGLGSKTALIGAIIVPIAYYCYEHKFVAPFSITRMTIRPRAFTRWTIGLLLVGSVGSYLYFSLVDLLTALNYEQLLRVYSETGLLTSALSYRDLKVLAYFDNLKSIFHVLFGVQANIIVDGFGADTPGPFMYEIDVFDYLGRVGVLGLLLTTVIIWRCAGLRHWSRKPAALRTMCFIILIVGLTVGHTLISSLNGMWMAFWLIAFGRPELLPSKAARSAMPSTTSLQRS